MAPNVPDPPEPPADAIPQHKLSEDIAIALDGAKLAEALAKSGMLDQLAAKLKELNDRLPVGIKATDQQLQALVANLVAQYSASVLEAVTTQVLADLVKTVRDGKGPVFHSDSALA
jgi:hypothetical protein